MKKCLLFPSLAMILLLASCMPAVDSSGQGLRVLATTTIVGDVVARVGGEYISLTVLLPAGSDPHVFTPRPQDAAAISDAQLIFASGAGLETFLPSLLDSTGAAEKVVDVSAGVDLLGLSENGGVDPHTWMDPNNVILWTDAIMVALSEADPGHADAFRANADAYIASLQELDGWIEAQVASVPAGNRILVADHAALGYFARRYGFSQGGSITGSFSSEAAPTARELAELENEIRLQGVRAIFLTEAANQAIVDQVAQDTGIPSIWLQVASLSQEGTIAPTYLDLMRYNVDMIVSGLK